MAGKSHEDKVNDEFKALIESAGVKLAPSVAQVQFPEAILRYMADQGVRIRQLEMKLVRASRKSKKDEEGSKGE